MKFNKTQLGVIIGAFLGVVLLLLANTKIPKKENEAGAVAEQKGSSDQSFKQLLEETRSKLPQTAQSLFVQQEKALELAKSNNAFDEVVHVWDSLQQPVLAAYFREQEAIHFPLEKTWEEAGARYYILTRFITPESRSALYAKAIDCYQNTLELNPQNVDTKIDLASCYVEMGVEPMKGIGLLREIEKTHPDNVKLQYSFAYFSVQSGQLEKAIARFEKIKQLQPDNFGVYYSLADVYERMGNKEKAIENYEKYASLTDDLNEKTEIRGHINSLKN